MLVTVLTVLFPEDRPRQIGLSVAAATYLMLTSKFSRLRIPDLCSSLTMLKGFLRCTIVKLNSISKITLRGGNFMPRLGLADILDVLDVQDVHISHTSQRVVRTYGLRRIAMEVMGLAWFSVNPALLMILLGT